MLPALARTPRRRTGGPGRRTRPGGARLVERPHLPRVERAPAARNEARVGERPDPRAHQPADGVADRLEHPADLAVAPLVDDDAQHARRDRPDDRRSGRSVVELDALTQPSEG